ncbi:MAG: NAD-dependent epimerase/dehydratase family protein [Firmicutes bacterium]|nr:NAD-dependent epimerase/dehydratase family protein [Bacillota bacterium]
MSKILITGGAGMIGSNLVKKIISEKNQVTVVDNLWRGKLDYLNFGYGKSLFDIDNNFYAIDLSFQGSLDHLLDDIDYVIHLADIVAGIGYVFDNQSFIFRQNLLINSNVINAVKNSKIKGFLYVGTACSFPESLQNELQSKQLKESQLFPANPESAYGWSKLMGQYETKLLEQEFNIPSLSLMLHNVYGSPCDFSIEKSQVIPSLIRKAINYPEEDFIVWGSGKQGRAFVHVNDVVEAIYLAIKKGWQEDTIQIGPSICTTIAEIAEEIVKLSGKNIAIKYDNTKPEGDKSRAADFSLARNVLGWRPKTDLSSGLKEQYDWIYKQINRES